MEVSIKSNNVEGLELYSDNYPFRLPLRIENFQNEADYTKFVRNCEKLVRGCLEYKEWRKYIIDVLGINSCMITEELMAECTVEVHHHIPSLFSLVKAIVNKKIEEGEKFSSFDIALKTIELHFMNKVGYVTLIKSMHEKFHNGCLLIPIDLVKGDYRFFINEYSRYLEEDDIETINKRISITDGNCGWKRNDYQPTQIVSGM